MTIYGYARVSTDGQTLAAQDAALHAAGCAKVYGEKQSGAKADRPELAKLLRGRSIRVSAAGGCCVGHLRREIRNVWAVFAARG